MKRFWLLAVAMLLLWLDISFVTSYEYPAYQESMDYGRQTQDFVMNEVVGKYLKVDLISDIPAWIILIVLVACGGPKVQPIDIVEENGKRTRHPRGKKMLCGERSAYNDTMAISFSFFSITALVLIRILPFFTNGVILFGSEYLIHLADVFLPLIALFFILSEWICRTEIMTTQMETQAASVTMMVSLFLGFFARFSDLFGFTMIHYISWILQGVLMVIALGSIYLSLRENARKIGLPEEISTGFDDALPGEFQ